MALSKHGAAFNILHSEKKKKWVQQMKIFGKMWSPSAVPLPSETPRTVFRIGNRRAVWHLPSLQFYGCPGLGLNHWVSRKKKIKNPVFYEWKQAVTFVNWVFICSATAVQMKMLISYVQIGERGLNHGANVPFLPNNSGCFATINATVPSGLPRGRKALIENVFFIV